MNIDQNTLIIILIIVFFISVVCFYLIKVSIPLLIKYNIVDIPKERKNHNIPTPTGGGIAIIVSFIIGFIIIESTIFHQIKYSIKIIPLTLTLAIVSFFDDIKHINILIRLFIHILASAILVFTTNLTPIFHGFIPIIIDQLLAIIALITFINIYNFMDGIDGITISQTIYFCLIMLILCYLKQDIISHAFFVIITMFLILGCSIAFIYYNWHPAKIFLGDVGSISLGFLMGICIIVIASSSFHLLLSCVIMSLYYLSDSIMTIIARLINKEKIWEPHNKHFFQQALKKGMSHNEVTSKIILCNFTLGILSIAALYYPILSFGFAISIVTLFIRHFSL